MVCCACRANEETERGILSSRMRHGAADHMWQKCSGSRDRQTTMLWMLSHDLVQLRLTSQQDSEGVSARSCNVLCSSAVRP
jgi:hypothetical protein